MNKPSVLVFRGFTADVEERLKREFDIILLSEETNLSKPRILELIPGCDAVCPSVVDRIDKEMIDVAGGRLKIITNFGVGYDNIDLEAARNAGVIVTNTPGVLTEATADIAMMLILMSARRAGEGERMIRNRSWSGWEPDQLLGYDITGKTLGLVGFGRIAEAVARRAYHGFRMKIAVYNRSAVTAQRLSEFNAVQYDSLAELLRNSDVISLHCPSTPDTRDLINQDAFRMMKRTAILINTARGDIVDEQALVEALNNRVIAGVGLDVYAEEPRISTALLDMENVVLLPHLGSATVETRSAMGMRMIDNLVDYFAGREPRDRVV